MSFVRPEVVDGIWRLREVIVTAVIAVVGLWMIWLGGWILVPVGLIVLGLGGSLVRHALARLRFEQAVGAPGIVELDEAQLGYLGPEVGGFISLNEAIELRMVTMRGRRLWRIKQADGQAMLVPIDAAGAGQLFDAFASLPGMDVSALAAAAGGGAAPAAGSADSSAQQIAVEGPQMHLIWRRAASAGLTAR